PHMMRELSRSDSPGFSSIAFSLPRKYANCSACHLLMRTSFAFAVASVSPACDSSWCDSFMSLPSQEYTVGLVARDHCIVATRVMSHASAAASRSMCRRPTIGNDADALRSTAPGLLGD